MNEYSHRITICYGEIEQLKHLENVKMFEFDGKYYGNIDHVRDVINYKASIADGDISIECVDNSVPKPGLLADKKYPVLIISNADALYDKQGTFFKGIYEFDGLIFLSRIDLISYLYEKKLAEKSLAEKSSENKMILPYRIESWYAFFLNEKNTILIVLGFLLLYFLAKSELFMILVFLFAILTRNQIMFFLSRLLLNGEQTDFGFMLTQKNGVNIIN
jgi:hypothetical protein